MSGIRVDFALIQPAVYGLETWLALRRRLPALLEEGGHADFGLTGTLHLTGESAPQFLGDFEEVDHLIEAFPSLLAQVRDLPCLVIDLPEPGEWLLRSEASWPAGLVVEAAESRLLVPRAGDIVLVHLASGTVEEAAGAGRPHGLQFEVRSMLRAALAAEAERVTRLVDDTVERILGRAASEHAADTLQPDGGHLVTLAQAASADVAGGLGRVHEVQEGSAANESPLLFPAPPEERAFAHFGWAYTTAATPRRGVSYRLIFPVIGVNLAWYRYRQLRKDLIGISRTIHALETDRALFERTEFFGEAVLDVRVWEAEREGFERGLRPVYRSVYDRLWEYWDTGDSRETVQQGIDSLREFLDRKYSVKIATRENTQARILFVIAIFQLLSVFGLVSGYLYFWERTRLPESAIYDSELMVWVTIVSPVIVLLGIVWLLVSFFRRHR